MPLGGWEKATQLRHQLTLARKQLARQAQLAGARPLVSIVMPTYNRASVINRSIQSVLDQTYKNWELIIVDDGSSDKTAEQLSGILRHHADRIRFIQLPTNQGVSAARNVGLRASRGEIVGYLDSDNRWYPECLEIMTHALDREPEALSAYAGQEIWENLSYFGSEELRYVRICPFNRSRLEKRNFIDLNVFFHRRGCLDKFGLFREDMRRLVDWELILRYTEEQPPLFVPVLLNQYFFGLSENQITATESYELNRELLYRAMRSGRQS